MHELGLTQEILAIVSDQSRGGRVTRVVLEIGKLTAVLPDAVHPTDPLLELHRIPRQVVVDDDMAELKIEALAAGIGRDHHPDVARERTLRRLALLEPHRAVEAHDAEAPRIQELGEHLLGRDELREDQDFEVWIVLLTLELSEPIEERRGLGA